MIEKFWKSTHEFSGKHLHELKCYIWGTWFIMFYQMRRGQKLKTMMWMSNNEQIWWFVNKWKLMINCVLSKSQNIWTTWFVGPDCRKFWNPDYDYNNVVISFDDDCFCWEFRPWLVLGYTIIIQTQSFQEFSKREDLTHMDQCVILSFW